MDIPEVRETLSAEKIRELVGNSPTILEIGSHEGSDTIKFANAMPQAKIHCFDCEQRAIQRFKVNVKHRENVFLYEVAIGDVDGEAEFFASTGKAGRRADWDFSGSLNKPTGHLQKSPEIKFKDAELVPSMRLDTWWEEIGSPSIDFIWADVQGAQMKVIRGATLILKATKYLYIECHRESLYEGEPTQESLIDTLHDYRFKPLGIYGRDNILFVKE